MPSVHNTLHERLIRDVDNHLTSKRYQITSIEYHKNESAKGLQELDLLAAHVIRTRADRIAYRKNPESLIRFDAKTCSWPTGKQFAIEYIPYLSACIEAIEFNLNHIFACRRRDGGEFGVLAGRSALHLFDKILVPEWRRGNDWIKWAKKSRDRWKLRCSVDYANCSGGSGDVLVTLNVENQPHWKTLIDKLS